MNIHPGHCVAIFGGAVSGAEAAYQLSQRGIYVVVFEQHPLPYGKIEDGLPKWHAKLRDQEEQKIDEKLNNPYVHYVPNTRLGTDIGIRELEEEWGCSAIMLAIGAWSDRHLPVPGVDEYVNKGLYYQNPLVAWFNHYHEPNYQGPNCQIANNTVIIGGGLASLDVVKIIMIELVQNALVNRGYNMDMFQLERVGINKVLDELKLSLADLGIDKCHLYYRRRVIDMPISPDAPPDAPPEKIEKVHQVRKKIIHHFQSKYLFEFHEQLLPYDKIVEDGRLVGLKFSRTEIVNGVAKPIPETNVEVKAPLFISSIGSIPEHIPSIASEGEIFRLKDPAIGKVTGYSNVFALGNAVTGRGNIKESFHHGRIVAEWVMNNFLKWKIHDYQKLNESSKYQGSENDSGSKMLSEEKIRKIMHRVKGLQQKVRYDGNYIEWVKKHRPVRLENLLASQEK